MLCDVNQARWKLKRISSCNPDRSAVHPFDDLAIEPIQHPERYVIPQADSTAKDLACQGTENVQQ